MTLKEQLKQQKEQNANLQKVIDNLNKNNQRLIFENEKLDTEIGSQIIELEAAEHQIKNYQKTNEHLKGKIAAYENVIRILSGKENNTPF